MSGIYKLEEVRLVQLRTVSSAADAHLLTGPSVPAGKIWIVHSVYYAPSVAETQNVCFHKGLGPPSNYYMPIFNPLSLALDGATWQMATPLEQGMEIMLLPGEFLSVSRAAHTAGSTMTLSFQFTEIDLPLYTYDDPQTVKRQERAIASIRTRLGGGLAGARGIVPPMDRGDRGGRGGPLEK